MEVPLPSFPRGNIYPQQNAGGQVEQAMRAFQTGFEFVDTIQARRAQRKLQTLLTKPGRRTEEDYREISKYSPEVASTLIQIDAALLDMKEVQRASALSSWESLNNMAGEMAYRLSKVPLEQRMYAFNRITEPLFMNPDTRPFVNDLGKRFANRNPKAPGGSEADFSDERLARILSTAGGLDAALAAKKAQMDREFELEIEAMKSKDPASQLQRLEEAGLSRADALAFMNPEHGVRTILTEDGREVIVGADGKPLFRDQGGELPPVGANQGMIGPEAFQGGQEPPQEPGPPGTGGWLDRLQGRAPGGQAPAAGQAPPPAAGGAPPPGAGQPPNIDPIDPNTPANPAELFIRANYPNLTEAQRVAIRSGAVSPRGDDQGNLWLDDAQTGHSVPIKGPARERSDQFMKQGLTIEPTPDIESIRQNFVIPPNMEQAVIAATRPGGGWEFWVGETPDGRRKARLVQQNGTQVIPLRPSRQQQAPPQSPQPMAPPQQPGTGSEIPGAFPGYNSPVPMPEIPGLEPSPGDRPVPMPKIPGLEPSPGDRPVPMPQAFPQGPPPAQAAAASPPIDPRTGQPVPQLPDPRIPPAPPAAPPAPVQPPMDPRTGQPVPQLPDAQQQPPRRKKLRSALNRLEGYRGKPYDDIHGNRTIGTGINIHGGEFDPEERAILGDDPSKATPEQIRQAEELNIERKEAELKRSAFPDMDQWPDEAYVAVMLVMWHRGGPSLRRMKGFVRALQNRDWSGAARELQGSKYGKGKFKSRVRDTVTMLRNAAKADGSPGYMATGR